MAGNSNKDLSRNNPNIFKAKPSIPIILIPGILGSRLKSAKSPDGIWDPDNTGLMLKHHVASSSTNQRSLFNEPKVEVMTDPNGYGKEQAARGWGEIVTMVYKTFLNTCQAHAFQSFSPRVYAIGYNWIQSNRDSCDRLKHRTKWILNREKKRGVEPKGFFYVTHSMGSLVVRAALKKHQDLARRCLGVVFVGPPNFGAVVFYRRFFTGVKHDDLAIILVMGDTPSKWSTAASAVRSAFELLPNNEYAAPGESPRQWLRWKTSVVPKENRQYLGPREMAQPPAKELYEVYSYLDYIPCIAHTSWGNVQKDIINNAKDARLYFHDWLGDYMPPKFVIISSKNVETDTKVEVTGTITVSHEPGSHRIKQSGYTHDPSTTRIQKSNFTAKAIRTRDGDGTVPISSQQAYKDKAIAVVELEGVNHADAIKNKKVMFRIFTWLDEMFRRA